MKQRVVVIDEEIYLKLKMQACVENKTIKSILKELLKGYLDSKEGERIGGIF